MLGRLLQNRFGSTPTAGHCFNMIVALCLLCEIVGQSLAAPPYRTDEFDARLRVNELPAKRYAQNPQQNAAERPKFGDFFSKYFFQSLTRTDPPSLAGLTEARDTLFKNCLYVMGDPEMQRQLTSHSYQSLLRIIESADPPPYHPAVRYNAVLMLGMLDDSYPNTGGQEIPHAGSRKALLNIVNSVSEDTKYPPAVILGALLGLERHASLAANLPPQDVAAMSSAALKIVSLQKPLAGIDREEQDWFRLRAAEVLARLGSAGDGNQNLIAVLKLTTELKNIDDRCDAAASLAKFKYDGVQLDGAMAAQHLLTLAAAVGDVEMALVNAYEQPTVTIGTDGNTFPKRPVVAQLTSLKAALIAVKPAVPADVQTTFDAALRAINSPLDTALDRNSIDVTLASRIRQMAGELKRLAPPPPAASSAEPAPAGSSS